MNGETMICPKCGRIADHDSYFGAMVCRQCGWMQRDKPANADRIRSMSDEELAGFLKAEMFNDFKPSCKKSTFFSADKKPQCGDDCISCIINWLRQPVEDKPCGVNRVK